MDCIVPHLSDAHGWDTFRTPWHVALDWMWFGEPRARTYLAAHLVPFLEAVCRRSRAW